MFVRFDLIVAVAPFTFALIFIDDALHSTDYVGGRGASDRANSQAAGTDGDP